MCVFCMRTTVALPSFTTNVTTVRQVPFTAMLAPVSIDSDSAPYIRVSTILHLCQHTSSRSKVSRRSPS